MTTKEKIEAFAGLYKQALTCRRDCGVDIIQSACLPVEVMEELHDFGRKFMSIDDRAAVEVINGLRAVLQNEVHTAAGFWTSVAGV